MENIRMIGADGWRFIAATPAEEDEFLGEWGEEGKGVDECVSCNFSGGLLVVLSTLDPQCPTHQSFTAILVSCSTSSMHVLCFPVSHTCVFFSASHLDVSRNRDDLPLPVIDVIMSLGCRPPWVVCGGFRIPPGGAGGAWSFTGQERLRRWYRLGSRRTRPVVYAR